MPFLQHGNCSKKWQHNHEHRWQQRRDDVYASNLSPIIITHLWENSTFRNGKTTQVAALLTNRVPVVQGGAEVLELSAKDTKTLYYMPTGGVRRLTLSTVKDLESVRAFLNMRSSCRCQCRVDSLCLQQFLQTFLPERQMGFVRPVFRSKR